MFCSSLHHPGPEKKFLKVSQTIRFPAMEKFVVPRRQKRSGTSEAPSPQKKIKLESDEKMKQEEEEEEGENASSAEFSHPVPWQKIEAEGLDCDYALLFSKDEADKLFRQLEEEVVYSTGTTSKPFSVKL